MTAQWLPKGFHTITPKIVADDAEGAVTYDPEVASWTHVVEHGALAGGG